MEAHTPDALEVSILPCISRGITTADPSNVTRIPSSGSVASGVLQASAEMSAVGHGSTIGAFDQNSWGPTGSVQICGFTVYQPRGGMLRSPGTGVTMANRVGDASGLDVSALADGARESTARPV